MIDNLKTGVIEHLAGCAPVFNARYLDYAKHCGFAISACNVAAGNEYVVDKNMSRLFSISPALPLKLTFL